MAKPKQKNKLSLSREELAARIMLQMISKKPFVHNITTVPNQLDTHELMAKGAVAYADELLKALRQ